MRKKILKEIRGNMDLLNQFKGQVVIVVLNVETFFDSESIPVEVSYVGFFLGCDNNFIYLAVDDGLEFDVAINIENIRHIGRVDKLGTNENIDTESHSLSKLN